MGKINKDSQLVIITEPKAIRSDLPKNTSNGLKNEMDSTIKHNEFLSEHTMKNKISRFSLKYKHGNDIHKHRKQ